MPGWARVLEILVDQSEKKLVEESIWRSRQNRPFTFPELLESIVFFVAKLSEEEFTELSDELLNFPDIKEDFQLFKLVRDRTAATLGLAYILSHRGKVIVAHSGDFRSKV